MWNSYINQKNCITLIYISRLKNSIDTRFQWNVFARATNVDLEAEMEEIVRKKKGYLSSSERSPLSADAEICIKNTKKNLFRKWCQWDVEVLRLSLICFQTKRLLILGGSQAKARDVERKKPSSVQESVIAQWCVAGNQWVMEGKSVPKAK